MMKYGKLWWVYKRETCTWDDEIHSLVFMTTLRFSLFVQWYIGFRDDVMPLTNRPFKSLSDRLSRINFGTRMIAHKSSAKLMSIITKKITQKRLNESPQQKNPKYEVFNRISMFWASYAYPEVVLISFSWKTLNSCQANIRHHTTVDTEEETSFGLDFHDKCKMITKCPNRKKWH